jgi:hypothetical protein
MIVQRRGGTVALKAVTDAIEKVQVGTDKTAAELAISRYKVELEELQIKAAKADEEQNKKLGYTFGCGIIVLFLGLALLFAPNGIGVSIIMFMIAAVVLSIGVKALRSDNGIGRMRSQIIALESKIADKIKIANS